MDRTDSILSILAAAFGSRPLDDVVDCGLYGTCDETLEDAVVRIAIVCTHAEFRYLPRYVKVSRLQLHYREDDPAYRDLHDQLLTSIHRRR